VTWLHSPECTSKLLEAILSNIDKDISWRRCVRYTRGMQPYIVRFDPNIHRKVLEIVDAFDKNPLEGIATEEGRMLVDIHQKPKQLKFVVLDQEGRYYCT
jgi:hypothetical protein